MGVDRSRRAKATRRRKRRMDRVEHDLTDAQWAALVTAWGGCAYCGSSTPALQRDHVLARASGGRSAVARSTRAAGKRERVTVPSL